MAVLEDHQSNRDCLKREGAEHLPVPALDINHQQIEPVYTSTITDVFGCHHINTHLTNATPDLRNLGRKLLDMRTAERGDLRGPFRQRARGIIDDKERAVSRSVTDCALEDLDASVSSESISEPVGEIWLRLDENASPSHTTRKLGRLSGTRRIMRTDLQELELVSGLQTLEDLCRDRMTHAGIQMPTSIVG